jgi:hypothetical protein
VVAGDLPQALAATAIAEDGLAVKFEWLSSDMPAFEPGASHAGFYSLDDQVRSSSAIAPMMTTMARPSGPDVSMLSGTRRTRCSAG